MIDARGIPTAICPECGNDEFSITVKFNKVLYFIENYSLEGQCIKCRTQISCPIPINNIKEENI
jgi:hypothetical protein